MKALALIGAAVFSAIATAQPQAIKDAMHHVYDGIQEGYNKRDVAVVLSFLSPDYTQRMTDGKTLKLSDAKKDLKEELRRIQSGKWTITIQNVMGGGPAATAVVQYKFKGVMLDDSNLPYNAEITSTERQTWIKGPNGWKQTHDYVLSASTKNNGRTNISNTSTPGQPIQQAPNKEGNNTNPQSTPGSGP